MSWEKDLQEYADQTRMDAPTLLEAQALVARARRQSAPGWRTARFALAAAAAAAVLWVVWPADQTATDIPVTKIEHAPEDASTSVAQAPRLLGPGHNDLLVDVVEVFEGGRVAVISEAEAKGQGAHTRLRLEQGRAHFEVASRTEGASFNVDAGDYQVRVVGTAFEVTRSPFQVRVSSGVVEVIEAAQTWAVQAGERFANGRVHSAPGQEAKPPVPELDALRRLVLGGELSQAQSGLKARLEADKRDVQTRILGAQLETKLGRPGAAVKHWEWVIKYGGTTQVQRARYEAAVLLSGSPSKAEVHLRAFLKTRGPLTADARLRLARALLAQGKTDAGRAELTRVVQDHPGATPARVARELLEAE